MALMEENVVGAHVGLFQILYRAMETRYRMAENGAIVENAQSTGWL